MTSTWTSPQSWGRQMAEDPLDMVPCDKMHARLTLGACRKRWSDANPQAPSEFRPAPSSPVRKTRHRRTEYLSHLGECEGCPVGAERCNSKVPEDLTLGAQRVRERILNLRDSPQVKAAALLCEVCGHTKEEHAKQAACSACVRWASRNGAHGEEAQATFFAEYGPALKGPCRRGCRSIITRTNVTYLQFGLCTACLASMRSSIYSRRGPGHHGGPATVGEIRQKLADWGLIQMVAE